MAIVMPVGLKRPSPLDGGRGRTNERPKETAALMAIRQGVKWSRRNVGNSNDCLAAWENPCPLPRSFDLGCPLQMASQNTLLLGGRFSVQAVPSLDEMGVASGREKLCFSEQLRKLGKQSAVWPPPHLPLSQSAG